MKTTKKTKQSKIRSEKKNKVKKKSVHKPVKPKTPKRQESIPQKAFQSKSRKLLGKLPFLPAFLICEECGREIVVDDEQTAAKVISCCGQHMKCKE